MTQDKTEVPVSQDNLTSNISCHKYNENVLGQSLKFCPGTYMPLPVLRQFHLITSSGAMEMS
jgi:hypothetical protein